MSLADDMRTNVTTANLSEKFRIEEDRRTALAVDADLKVKMLQKAIDELPKHLANIESHSRKGMTSYNIMISGWDTSGPYGQRETPSWVKHYCEALANLIKEKGFQIKEEFDHNEPHGSDPYYDYPHTTLYLRVMW